MTHEMDTEAFVRWALDDSRTVEERYPVELLVEEGIQSWKWKRKIHEREPIDDRIARDRERKLNPAYQPHYTEDSLRKAVESLAVKKSWSPHTDRPIRDLSVLRFMPAIEELVLTFCFEGEDLSPLPDMPALRKLAIGYQGTVRTNAHCRDYTPLARCSGLRDLLLSFAVHWPDFTGVGDLTQLDTLSLTGNLLALPHGVSFPNVRTAALYCLPLASRNMADLPQLPACEFLTLAGAERLDGIGKMPALRNLTLRGPFHSFEPLVGLHELTALTVTPDSHLDPPKMPRDVAPLARLPKLHYLKFGPPHDAFHDMPRDYSPLTEAPVLRELIVLHCPPVAVEVASIQAGLQPCDELYLAEKPAPIPPLRMIMAPVNKQPPRDEVHLSPGESSPADEELRACEGRWVGAWLGRHIASRIGHSDWGEASACGVSRTLDVTIQSYDCVGKMPLIFEAIREAMACLRHGYRRAAFGIHLRIPPPEETPAQKELVEKFREEEDCWAYEQRQRDEREYLDGLHRLELKRQEGAAIQPEEFSPSEQEPSPEPPWETENDEEEDEENDGEWNLATKERPELPAMCFDDTHPLADKYLFAGTLTFEGAWFYSHFRDLAIQLMGREPDEEIPKDPEPEES